jgi:hypothetical protein
MYQSTVDGLQRRAQLEYGADSPATIGQRRIGFSRASCLVQ